MKFINLGYKFDFFLFLKIILFICLILFFVIFMRMLYFLVMVRFRKNLIIYK